MTDKEKEKLTRISRLLDNNQVNDPELKAKLQAERDMLEEKAGTSTPAPKSKPAPKAMPKAKKAAAQAPKAKKSGETVMEYAKRTRKSGESWNDAVKRSSKEVKNGGKPVAKKIKKAARKAKPVAKKIKKSVTKKTVAKDAPKKIKKSAVKKKAAQTLPRVIKRVKHLNGSTSIAKDKKVRALASGKRMSKAGNIYYEYRANRADLNRTKKLEKGGELEENEYYQTYVSLKSGFDLYSTNGEESSETLIGNYKTLEEAKEIAKQKGLKAKPIYMR